MAAIRIWFSALIALVCNHVFCKGQPHCYEMCQGLFRDLVGFSAVELPVSEHVCQVINSFDDTAYSLNKRTQNLEKGLGPEEPEVPRSDGHHIKTYQLRCMKKNRPAQEQINVISGEMNTTQKAMTDLHATTQTNDTEIRQKRKSKEKIEQYKTNDISRNITIPPHNTNPFQNGRFLLANYLNKRNGTIYQLSLTTKALVPYPHLTVRKVTGMAYIATINTLFLSTFSMGVISSPLDSTKKSKLLKIRVMTLAVDGKKKFLFLLTDRVRKQRVLRMNSTGKPTEVLFRCSAPATATAIAVDDVRQRVFIAERDLMTTISYEGQDRKILHKDVWSNLLSVDTVRNVLYYNSGNKLFRKTLRDNRKKRIKKMRFRMRSVIYFQNRLLITPAGGTEIGWLTKSKFTVFKKTRVKSSFLCSIVP